MEFLTAAVGALASSKLPETLNSTSNPNSEIKSSNSTKASCQDEEDSKFKKAVAKKNAEVRKEYYLLLLIDQLSNFISQKLKKQQKEN